MAGQAVRAVLSLTQLIPGLRRAGDCAPYLIMLLLTWQAARAQTAADFFNSGAHFYISNNIPEALVPVEQGMKQYPDDVKLKKLYELLKQQQQQQQQQQQSQQNQQNQSQQQKSQSQQNQQQQKQQQSQQNSQQQKQDRQKQSEQKNGDQQKQPQSEKSGEKQDNQNEQGQPVAAGQMTPEEAKRLLDAQKGNEQFLQPKPQGKPENPNQAIKDW
jgi:Ca-activated chloride channel family protein